MLRTRDVSLGVGWGGVGMMTYLALAHMFDATHRGRFSRGGVGWGWWRSSDLRTCLMLRTRDVSLGVGWGGVGMMTFLGLAHMVDATQVMGWGGVGMMTFLGLAHMVDATQVMGWGVMTSFGVNLLIWTMLGWHLNHCCWVLKVDYNHHLHLQDIWRLLWPWMFWRLTTIFYMFKYINKSYLFWFPFNQVDVQSSLSKFAFSRRIYFSILQIHF